MKRKKPLKLTTPVGIAEWPRLNTPDTKYNSDGVYSVLLRLPKDDCTETIEAIRSVVSDYVDMLKKEEGKKEIATAPLPFKDVMDGDNVPTGEIEIKFKLNALGKNGNETWEQRPMLFDSHKRPISENIGGGSKIKVGAEVVPYFTTMHGAGVTLRLKAVQVIELVEYSNSGSPESWGFGKEEGFVSNSDESEKNDGEYDF